MSEQPSAQVTDFERRKQDHIRLALEPGNEASGQSMLDAVTLQHEALPNLDFEDISLECTRFGSIIPSPFLISSMTAGHHDAVDINLNLALAAEKQGWAMGVGSQRRQLFDASARQEWTRIREQAPKAILFGNIGIAQLIHSKVEDIQSLVDSLSASAMIVHANPLQECIQPEGTPQFRGGLSALDALCDNLSVPVILKETGCGFSQKTLERLCKIDIAAVDVSGFGGTHWGRIEGGRAKAQSPQQAAATTFKNWGESTLSALLSAYDINPHYEIWASGGIRSGLDAAKCIALGASTVGFAKPMLQAALDGGVDAIVARMQQIEYELKIALFCTGCETLDALQENNLCQIKM